jgi:oxygen-independent coproporphyrinogen-3 oxidase
VAGIYIHIPFCLQACHYCDFHFSTSLKNKLELLLAIEKELIVRKNYLSKGELINSIYFGGGTPSILSREELSRIFDTIYSNYNISESAEITLEANPEDLNSEKLRALKNTPVNRFSIGVQSFFEDDLKFMNRAHSVQKAVASVKGAQDAGFENISIDLIYGTPTLSDEKWKQNLQTAFDLKVKHISSYCLTVEEKTALHKFVQIGKVKNVDEEKSATQFEILLEAMQKNNFVQYEISNFCSNNFYSQHNSNYWLKKKYLGVGPSAHSYNEVSRQWNIKNNALYIKGVDENKLNFEIETLTPSQNYNEYIMTGLRTMWGISLSHIENVFGKDVLIHCKNEASKYSNSGYIDEKNNCIFLTSKGKLLADKIAADLFLVD